jgi:glycosyltransferase involved in cell wall biosynthesis
MLRAAAGWIYSSEPGGAGKAFLYAGALVPYKRVDLVVAAFNELRAPLWIAGAGPQERRLRGMAADNITFLGHVPDAKLAQLYRDCRALVFPAVEDFGMVPVECMAAGRPVIALDAGGVRESVKGLRFWDKGPLAVNEATGVFIRDRVGGQREALLEALDFFIKHEKSFCAEACIKQARLFSPERFFNDWRSILNRQELAGGDSLRSYA